jgi:hypothetical protein
MSLLTDFPCFKPLYNALVMNRVYFCTLQSYINGPCLPLYKFLVVTVFTVVQSCNNEPCLPLCNNVVVNRVYLCTML